MWFSMFFGKFQNSLDAERRLASWLFTKYGGVEVGLPNTSYIQGFCTGLQILDCPWKVAALVFVHDITHDLSTTVQPFPIRQKLLFKIRPYST